MNRRSLLRTSALAIPAIALAACSTTTVNGTTVITVNLATVNAYAQALENGANMLLSIPAISTAMGPANVAIVGAATKGVASAIAALDTAYKGQASFTFTASTAPAALNALLTDANQINGATSAVVASLGTQISSSALTTIDAIQTIASTLIAISTGAVGESYTKMPVPQALAVLGVKAPA